MRHRSFEYGEFLSKLPPLEEFDDTDIEEVVAERPRDPNQRAKQIVDLSTGNTNEASDPVWSLEESAKEGGFSAFD